MVATTLMGVCHLYLFYFALYIHRNVINHRFISLFTVPETWLMQYGDIEALLDSQKRRSEYGMNIYHYKCSWCAKLCAKRDNMRQHLRTHTGHKPYRCGVCGHTFITCSAKKKHVAIKHGTQTTTPAGLKSRSTKGNTHWLVD